MRPRSATCFRLLALGIIIATCWAGPALALHYYVDGSAGNDAWSGTLAEPNGEDGPFATLERARDAIRALKQAGGLPPGGVTVFVRGGLYRRTAGFSLGAADSGTPDAPIVYRAFEDETVRIVGGRQINDFAPVSNSAVLDRLSDEARRHVLQADLRAQGITDFGVFMNRGFRWQALTQRTAPLAVVYKNRPCRYARYPNQGEWLNIATGSSSNYFFYSGDRPSGWQNHAGVMVHGYWGSDYADLHETVTSIDTASRRVTLADTPYFKYTTNSRYYFYNVLEELDEPGEFFVDRTAGILYFWPPGPVGSGDVLITELEEPLIKLDGASHITFDGLILEATRHNGFDITGGTGCIIEHCTVRNIGGTAIQLTEGSDHTVRNCTVAYCDEDGIAAENCSNITVHNNVIHDFALAARTYHPGVLIGAGESKRSNNCTVTHNEIYNAPQQGILCYGSNNLFEYNEVHHCVQETHDSGALYMNGRGAAQPGNVIRYNYFHHNRTNLNDSPAAGYRAFAASVYLDDGMTYTEIFGNLFEGTDGYSSSYGILLNGAPDGHLVENNIFVIPGQYSIRMHLHEPGSPRNVQFLRNIIQAWSMEFTAGADPSLQTIRYNMFATNPKGYGDNTNTVGVDPLFVDAAAGNYQLQDESPAYDLGFQRVPIELMGLIPEDLGTSPPVLDPVDRQTVTVGDELTFALSATDPDGDPLSFSMTGLPEGARFDTAGTFSWTPTSAQVGDYALTATVTDGTFTDSQAVTISVRSGGSADTIPSHPNVFISAAEIDAIKAKLQAGEQPWKAAYDQMIANANAALGQPLRAVTDDGGGHYFRTDDPYLSDGVYDPNAHRDDYSAAGEVCRAVRDLGLGYAFTGNASYADKAIQLIYHWCLNPDTYMEPVAWNMGPATPGHNSGGTIELYITIPCMFYGADLIWNFGGWDSAQKEAFKTWVSRFCHDSIGRWELTNNKESWKQVMIGSGAALIEDEQLLLQVFERFRTYLPEQIDALGRMSQELGRTNSLSYSLYALNAMTQVAEIARHFDVNLYDYTCDGTRGLKLALDYYDHFAINWRDWPFAQGEALTATKNVALFELAHSYWQQESFLNVINFWGRPMTETRVLGPITLTHGNRFDLDVAAAHRPVLDPIGGRLVRAGEPVELRLTASDEDGDPLVFSCDGLPQGAQFDPLSGLFTWTPSDEQAGSHRVTFTVSDGELTDSETVAFVVITSDTTIPTDYIGWWKFDGNANDSSIFANDGTLQGAANPANNTLQLDGGYVDLPDTINGMTHTQGTILAWVHPELISSTMYNMVYANHGTNAWDDRIYFGVGNGNQVFVRLGESPNSYHSTIATGTWSHVALTWDGSNYSVYQDGAPVAQGTYSGLDSLGPHSCIGALYAHDRQDYESFFYGAIDDVMIYPRPLAPEEIAAIFAMKSVEGDANGDGTVSILDLVFVRNCLNRNPASDPDAAKADVNADGVVDILDMIKVRNCMLGTDAK